MEAVYGGDRTYTDPIVDRAAGAGPAKKIKFYKKKYKLNRLIVDKYSETCNMYIACHGGQANEGILQGRKEEWLCV